MIITQTPTRISFLGGGTDYPSFFTEHGGATLATSIDKFTLITVHPLTRFADHRLRVHYSQVEAVQDLDEIRHPSARECLRFLGIESGVEIHYVSDLPARTGLGSSSSATVGLLHALHAYKGEMVSPRQLAEETIHIEQEVLQERVGSQDQYCCALGGLRYLRFAQDSTVQADPMTLPKARIDAFQRHLMLLYTGVQRLAHEVLEEQLERTVAGDNTQGLLQLKELTAQGVQHLASDAPLEGFGELLHEGWLLKCRLSSKITSPLIDEAYARARQAGAIGGKLLGAGGGGFLLLFARPDDHPRIAQALPELRQVRFAFEDAGSHVIFYRP
ncbi:MAG: GHMP family kinase ATP-binding protein [Armatimonadota bacterium]